MAYAKNNTKETLTCEVLEEIAVLSKADKNEKLLAFVKWGDHDPKLEVRDWYVKADESKKGNKGITLTVEECMALRDALNSIDFTKYAPTEKGKAAANKAKEPATNKATTTRKKATTAANKAKEPEIAKAKEPTEAEKLAETLANMSAADLLKILVK